MCGSFFIGDAVSCAMADQNVPEGPYHLDRMIASAIGRGAGIGCCSTCTDARGLDDDHLTKGARRATLDELADWTVWADKVASF
jgi:uncharacterized protein involved in oxidation of intracellular sulfur